MNQPNLRRNEEGFTLLEVLIAMTIFSIGVLALAQVQFAAYSNNMQSRLTSTASSLASDRLEEIVYGASFDGIRTTSSPMKRTAGWTATTRATSNFSARSPFRTRWM